MALHFQATMTGPIPSNAPSWVYGIYYIIIAIGGAMIILIPLGAKAYADVMFHVKRMRQTENAANAAAVNSAITAKKMDSMAHGNTGALPSIQPVVPIDTTEADVMSAASAIKEAIRKES
ncbi:MAG: hypothetical protein ACJ8BW_23875 [Ktedonobacteraceae bacterium]